MHIVFKTDRNSNRNKKQAHLKYKYSYYLLRFKFLTFLSTSFNSFFGLVGHQDL